MAVKITIGETEIQSECPVDATYNQRNYIGEVSNVIHKDGVLSFDFGLSKVYVKTNDVPEWLVDGVRVEIDFVNNAIIKH